MVSSLPPNAVRVPMQVHSELRIKKTGEFSISNPIVGFSPNDLAASAVVSYRFEPGTEEHVIRLEEPMSTDRGEAARQDEAKP